MGKRQKKQHVVVYPVFWPQKVLETIGRFTYRSIFWLIAAIFKLGPLLLIFYSLLLAFSLIFYWFILKDLPDPTDLIDHRPTLSTKIYDRHATLLFTFYKDQNRSLVA